MRNTAQEFYGMIMKQATYKLCCMIWLLLLPGILFGASQCAEAKVKAETWSFDFMECSVSDALRQMSATTGVDIVTNVDRKKQLLYKSYRNQSIEQILKDLFRKENCAMVWHYTSNSLESVDILIFEGSDRGSFFRAKTTQQDTMTRLGNKKRIRDSSAGSRATEGRYERSKEGKLVSPQPLQGERGSIFSQYGDRVEGARQGETDDGGYTVSDRDGDETIPSLHVSRPEILNLAAKWSDGAVNQDEEQALETIPTPSSEEHHGLEPPPMPPGFSAEK
jgi:hypothetical protein